MNGSLVQLLVLAAIAVFLILRLRNVLGTRDGFEPRPDAPAQPQKREHNFEVIDGSPDPDIADHTDPDGRAGKALAAMKRIEPDFSVGDFMGGGRQAYEMILMGFENGEMEEIKPFLSADVYDSFDSVVQARAEQGLTVEAQFVGLRKLELADAMFDEANNEAEITLRFMGELTSAVRDQDGELVEGDPNIIKKQKDVWTFARIMGSDDPNWQLVATGE